ncbi:hypothetical protein HY450_01540 [Candidatus Pacearchaeota archaeon]|nr:hypothetical protein [Candidatus Pacearchaeota archaeon]
MTERIYASEAEGLLRDSVRLGKIRIIFPSDFYNQAEKLCEDGLVTIERQKKIATLRPTDKGREYFSSKESGKTFPSRIGYNPETTLLRMCRENGGKLEIHTGEQWGAAQLLAKDGVLELGKEGGKRFAYLPNEEDRGGARV